MSLMARVDQARSSLQTADERLAKARGLCKFNNFVCKVYEETTLPHRRRIAEAIEVINDIRTKPLIKLAQSQGSPLAWNTLDALASGFEGPVKHGEKLVKKFLGVQDPDDKRLKRTWGSTYGADFKDKWVREHATLIREAAAKYGLPPELVAGVIWQEAGVVPDELDTAMYELRKLRKRIPFLADHELPGPLSRFGGSEEKTSFGQIQMQIRTAAGLLGYEHPEDLSEAQEEEIIAKLTNPASSIDLAAKYLAELREKTSQDFPDTDNNPGTMSDDEFVAVAAQYNQGEKPLNELKNKGYGKNILDLRDNTRSLLD